MPKKSTESAVLLIGDSHIGKRTESFDTPIAQERLARVAGRVEKVAALLKDNYILDELVVLFLGDVVDGELIYPGQSFEIDASARKQVKNSVYILRDFFSRMLKTFPRILLDGVAGNHGRTVKHGSQDSNWDIIAYDFLTAIYADHPKIKTGFDVGDKWLKLVEIRGHPILLNHARYVRMYQNVPWYGLSQRALRWQVSIGKFEALAVGHFHTFGYWDIGVHLFQNGTLVSDDPFGKEAIGYPPGLRWWLFGASAERLPTWMFALDTV